MRISRTLFIIIVCLGTAALLVACQTEPPARDLPLPAPTDNTASASPTSQEPFASPLATPAGGDQVPEALRGDLILFTSNRGGASAYYVMKPDGSAVTNIPFAGAPATVLGPTWVSQLDRFIFCGRTDDGQDIYLTDWAGTSYVNLSGLLWTAPRPIPISASSGPTAQAGGR